MNPIKNIVYIFLQVTMALGFIIFTEIRYRHDYDKFNESQYILATWFDRHFPQEKGEQRVNETFY